MLIMVIYANGEEKGTQMVNMLLFVVGIVGDLCFGVQFLEGIEQNLLEPCLVYVKS